MVKGCHRRVVFIKNLDSDLYSEAYFVLTEGRTQTCGDEDMIGEATRIVNESVGIKDKKCQGRGVPYHLLHTLLPFAIGLGIGIIMALIF